LAAEAAADGWDPFAAFGDATAILGGIPAATQEAAQATERWVVSVQDGVTTYDQLGGFATQATAAAKQGAIEAGAATEDFRLKLLEIQSDERLGIVKLGAEVDIANIEAAAETYKATINSITASIESTGSVINKVFDNLTEEGGVSNLDAIKQLRLENERRDQAFRDQGRLVDAQVESLRAQSAATNRGDPTIVVQADGLKPHLEAIWFEILEAMQVQARLNPGAALVGCGL